MSRCLKSSFNSTNSIRPKKVRIDPSIFDYTDVKNVKIKFESGYKTEIEINYDDVKEIFKKYISGDYSITGVVNLSSDGKKAILVEYNQFTYVFVPSYSDNVQKEDWDVFPIMLTGEKDNSSFVGISISYFENQSLSDGPIAVQYSITDEGDFEREEIYQESRLPELDIEDIKEFKESPKEYIHSNTIEVLDKVEAEKREYRRDNLDWFDTREDLDKSFGEEFVKWVEPVSGKRCNCCGVKSKYIDRHYYKKVFHISGYEVYTLKRGFWEDCENCRERELPHELCRRFHRENNYDIPDNSSYSLERSILTDDISLDDNLEELEEIDESERELIYE